MVKKIDIEETEKDSDIEESKEYISKEEIEETPKKDFKLGKLPLKVYRIEADELILVDPAGNGIRIPLPEEYRELKPGDIIYL